MTEKDSKWMVEWWAKTADMPLAKKKTKTFNDKAEAVKYAKDKPVTMRRRGIRIYQILPNGDKKIRLTL